MESEEDKKKDLFELDHIDLANLGERANPTQTDIVVNRLRASHPDLMHQPGSHADQANVVVFGPRRQPGASVRPPVYFGPSRSGEVIMLAQDGRRAFFHRGTLSLKLAAMLFPVRAGDLGGQWYIGEEREKRPIPTTYEDLPKFRQSLLDARHSEPAQHQLVMEFGGRLEQLQEDKKKNRLTNDEFDERVRGLQDDLMSAHDGTDLEDSAPGTRVFETLSISTYAYTIASQDLMLQKLVESGRRLEAIDPAVALLRAVIYLMQELPPDISHPDSTLRLSTANPVEGIADQVIRQARRARVRDPQTLERLQVIGQKIASGEQPPRAPAEAVRVAREKVADGADAEYVAAKGEFFNPDDINLIYGPRMSPRDREELVESLLGNVGNSEAVYAEMRGRGYNNPFDLAEVNENLGITTALGVVMTPADAVVNFQITDDRVISTLMLLNQDQ